ncbi:MAG TPA: hypothetical protein VFB04_15795 [Terriglobales bacterium]|nr:hypothetical protein [Terriglobales bacterium]
MADNPKPPGEMQPAPVSQAPGYDEFGTAKRNLPPAAPVAIALVVVAIIVGIVAYTQRAKPAAQGHIDGVWFSQPAGMSSPMLLLEITLHNSSDKIFYIKSIQAAIKTDQGEQSDEAASASDYSRYLQAYPELGGHSPALQVETKIPPGGEQKGSVMVTFPITQQQFDARKDLTVTIEPYDQRPVVLHEKSGADK